MMDKLAVYIHIPFCVAKCNYCDFLSFPCFDRKDDYTDALIREICAFPDAKKYSVLSVYFGGGTPSCIAGDDIFKIMSALRDTFELENASEISIECNPGTVDEEKLNIYKECGIGRISFGLQSANDDELRMLGRIHTYEDFLKSYRLARKCGFDNINIDIMSGLPYSCLERFKYTLEKVVSLEPEHISAYSLIVEEGTPLFNTVKRLSETGNDVLPQEEEDRKMYHFTKEYLEKCGYLRYEISNYAKAGFECRHNISYWDGTDYMGFGLGSSSLLDGVRFSNTRNIDEYIRFSPESQSLRCNVEYLSREDKMWEYVMLALRMMSGVDRDGFEKKFGTSFDSVYKDVTDKYIKLGLLEYTDGRLRLTDKGIDVSNVVMADYML